MPSVDHYREVEQHHDPVLDLIVVNLLRHLAGPVSITLELKSRVRPLLIGLNPSEGEVHRNNNSIKPHLVYQT